MTATDHYQHHETRRHHQCYRRRRSSPATVLASLADLPPPPTNPHTAARYHRAVETPKSHYQSHLFNWPMFAAGRICTQSILDTLIVRLATDPGMADFWNR